MGLKKQKITEKSVIFRVSPVGGTEGFALLLKKLACSPICPTFNNINICLNIKGFNFLISRLKYYFNKNEPKICDKTRRILIKMRENSQPGGSIMKSTKNKKKQTNKH